MSNLQSEKNLLVDLIHGLTIIDFVFNLENEKIDRDLADFSPLCGFNIYATVSISLRFISTYKGVNRTRTFK